MILTLAGAAVVGFAVGGGAYLLDRLALAMIRPPPKRVGRGVEKLGVPYRKVAIDSGGVKLTGWILEPETDGRSTAVVMVHGWGSSHARMIRLAVPLLEAGHPVFLFDVRHHGASRGAPYVTARHFRDDIVAACRTAAELLPDRSLVLVGHSMGGATGILAVAEGAPVEGLILVAAPADLMEIWARSFELKGLPGRLIVTGMKPFWGRRVGVPFHTLNPEEKIAQLGVPILILQGSDDVSVPEAQAHRLAEAAGTKATVYAGLGHSDLLELGELHENVLTFLDARLSGGRGGDGGSPVGQHRGIDVEDHRA